MIQDALVQPLLYTSEFVALLREFNLEIAATPSPDRAIVHRQFCVGGARAANTLNNIIIIIIAVAVAVAIVAVVCRFLAHHGTSLGHDRVEARFSCPDTQLVRALRL